MYKPLYCYTYEVYTNLLARVLEIGLLEVGCSGEARREDLLGLNVLRKTARQEASVRAQIKSTPVQDLREYT